MSNEKSCVSCKFLYVRDNGYSNYTVEGTDVFCAKDRNPNLSAEEPYDWKKEDDNWPLTNSSKCELYSYSIESPASFDVEGEITVTDQISDPEAIDAICAHSGLSR